MGHPQDAFVSVFRKSQYGLLEKKTTTFHFEGVLEREGPAFFSFLKTADRRVIISHECFAWLSPSEARRIIDARFFVAAD